MSYDNAEPKVLKTLNSSGQVLDDSGNVINDTSDYWVQLYNQTEPKVDKILKSDGTIVDAAGNLIQDTTEFNVKKYNQAEPIPAKYLHADGTIDENPGSGSGANLEDNKTETIDVSTYTEPVEVEPSQGYDGMKKATITLSNIPSAGATVYAWYDVYANRYIYLDISTAPDDGSGIKLLNVLEGESFKMQVVDLVGDYYTYAKISDTSFSLTASGQTHTINRVTSGEGKEFTLW